MSRQTVGPSRARLSAGLLMYRRVGPRLCVLIVHPGGPYYRNRDEGWWSIPKGEPSPGEDLLETAKREFLEETGLAAQPPFLPLGSVRQRSGKVVHAWAFAGDWDEGRQLASNRFTLEWPPGSGRHEEFSEIDSACMVDPDTARRKLNSAQASFIETLLVRIVELT